MLPLALRAQAALHHTHALLLRAGVQPPLRVAQAQWCNAPPSPVATPYPACCACSLPASARAHSGFTPFSCACPAKRPAQGGGGRAQPSQVLARSPFATPGPRIHRAICAHGAPCFCAPELVHRRPTSVHTISSASLALLRPCRNSLRGREGGDEFSTTFTRRAHDPLRLHCRKCCPSSTSVATRSSARRGTSRCFEAPSAGPQVMTGVMAACA